MIRLTPGVFGDGALEGGGGSQLPGTNVGGPSATDSIFKVENGVQVIANGTRQNSNNFQIDGVSVNSTSWGGGAVITPNEESVKEVRIIANNYSAEYGRNSGAQILVVSQNGTNDFTAAAFSSGTARPQCLPAVERTGVAEPRSERRIPVQPVWRQHRRPHWKNRLFAFFSYETFRNGSKSIATNWYETPDFCKCRALQQHRAAALVLPREAPLGTVISELRGGRTPSTQCRDISGGLDLGSPLASALSTLDPTYAQTGTPYGIGGGFDGVPDAQYILTRGPNLNTSVQYNGRLDFQATTKDSFAFSSYFVPVDSRVSTARIGR